MTDEPRPGVPARVALRDDSLLAAWLGAPTPRADLMVRERLHDLLRLGTQRPLTVVSAPAGSGKSALVGCWVRSGAAPGPVVWLTLEVAEDGQTLWPVLLIGLERAGVDVSDLVDAWSAGTSARPVLLALARRIAEHQTPVVLVLEEAECLRDRALSADLDLLLRHCDANLRLVVIARADTGLPLHRHRLERSVTEVRAAELAFTRDEAAMLFDSWGIRLTDRQLRKAVRRTSGWAAGLAFLAIELERSTDVDETIRDFAGSRGEVADYLSAEVLDDTSPELREVLLRTSVLRNLTPQLVAAATGRYDGQRLLDDLARTDVPLERVDEHTFRYPPLFRDFLRGRLEHERPDLAETGVPDLGSASKALVLVEPLTKRELEVLGHLADLLTTAEIAAAMGVSVNTVRTHIRNVLRKLRATRRNEAVRTAWELRLVPRSAEAHQGVLRARASARDVTNGEACL